MATFNLSKALASGGLKVTSTPKKTTTPPKTTNTLSYSPAVAKQQADLNKKGATLKVDGLLGPKTQAAINKFSTSSGSSSTSKTNTASKTNVPTKTSPSSVNKVGSGTISARVNTPMFANPFSGGFFKNVAGGVKMVGGGIKDAIRTSGKKFGDTLSANVLNATGRSALPESYGQSSYLPGEQLAQQNDPSFYNEFNMQPLDAVTGGGNITNAEAGYGANPDPADPNNMALTPGQLGGPSGNNYPATSSSKTTTSSVDTSVTAPTTLDSSSASLMSTGTSTGSIPGLGAFVNDLNMGLNGDSINDKTAWMSPGSKSEFQSAKTINYANSLASRFTSPEQASQWLSSPEGQQATKAYVDMGGKLQDIIQKVQPVTNGITPAQTTAEYLSGGPASLNEERKVMNNMIANELQFTKQMRDVYVGSDAVRGIAEQQKIENEARIEYYDRQEARMEKNLKDKARLAIDRAEAEYEAKDAETELARLNAKSNLTEFLAKIGALRTDGNALTGLEKLEQAYQAQRQSLRQNFQFAKREIQSDMEDKIFSLESDVEDKKFKLSQDLSKTEREVQMEVAKLDYGLQKTLNEYKLKWSDSIKSEKEKAAAKSEKLAGDYYMQFFTETGAKTFAGLSSDYKEAWKANAPTWLTPDYKGQITGEQVAKSYNQYNVDQGNIDQQTIPMQGPDGISYNVPTNQVDAFIQAGGRKL